MIRKSAYRFSEEIMLNQRAKAKRDGDSTKPMALQQH